MYEVLKTRMKTLLNERIQWGKYGIHFSTLLYQQAQNQFSRSITITPIVSNPGAPAFTMRGIYDTGPVDIEPTWAR